MVLVFIFFIILCLSILTTKLKINVKKFNITNEEIKTKDYFKNLDVRFEIYILKYIKIFSRKITKIQIQRLIEKNKSKTIKNNKNTIKQLHIKLEQLNLYIEEGTENVILTSFFVFIISTIISIFLSEIIDNFDREIYEYKIKPNYTIKSYVNIRLEGKISIHLVNILKVLVKDNLKK